MSSPANVKLRKNAREARLNIPALADARGCLAWLPARSSSVLRRAARHRPPEEEDGLWSIVYYRTLLGRIDLRTGHITSHDGVNDAAGLVLTEIPSVSHGIKNQIPNSQFSVVRKRKDPLPCAQEAAAGLAQELAV